MDLGDGAGRAVSREKMREHRIGFVLILSVLVIALCVSAALRHPLKRVFSVVTVLTGACALVTVWRNRHTAAAPRVLVAGTGVFVLAAALLPVPVRQCHWDGFVIDNPDGWSYAVFGKYLWENPRGADRGLPVTDQYSSHLQNARLASASLIAYLSMFVRPGDPASAMMLFLAVSFAATFMANYDLSRALELPPAIAGMAAVLSVLGGWMYDAVLLGNLDSILFLPVATALFSQLVSLKADERPAYGRVIPLVLLAGAAFYIYPEGCALFAVLSLPVAVALLRRAWGSRRHRLLLAAACAGAVLVAGPYLTTTVRFLTRQFSTTSLGHTRPGDGNFEGLLSQAFLPAFFALGEEYPRASFSLWNLALPLLLTAALASGAAAMRSRQRDFVLCLLPFAVLIGWEAFHAKYAYGLYKVLFLATYVESPMLACGIERVFRRLPRHSTAAAVVGTFALIAWIAVERLEDVQAWTWRIPQCVEDVRELEGIRYVAGNKPVSLRVNSDFEQVWAAYYLRDVRLEIPQPRGYFAMPHITPVLARGRGTGGEPPKYRLIRGGSSEAIWSNGAYSLIADSGADVVRVSNPNGLEQVDGDSFLWLGNTPAVFTLRAPRPGPYLLKARQFLPGPSLPGKPERTLTVETAAGTRTWVFGANAAGIPMELEEGVNTVKVTCIDRPTIDRQPNGDTRPLLLGLQGYYLTEAAGEGRAVGK
jgi:hypothetical protein